MGVAKTSHYKIFDYWKTKFIKEDGTVSDDGNCLEMVVGDWGEPSCWACGKPIVSKKEQSLQENSDYEQLWNDTHGKLEKCHIVPAAMGGKDEPSNLFLLCPNCHAMSPDTTNPSSFFRWVYNKRQHSAFGKPLPADILPLIDKELKQRGIKEGLEGVKNVLDEKGKCDYSDCYDYLKEHAGLHCSALAPSTLIAVFTDYLCSKRLDVLLEDE